MVHRRQCPCIGFELVAVWSQESSVAQVRAPYIARKSIRSIPTPMNFDRSSNHVVAYLVCLLEQGVHRRALTKDNEENEDSWARSR